MIAFVHWRLATVVPVSNSAGRLPSRGRRRVGSRNLGGASGGNVKDRLNAETSSPSAANAGVTTKRPKSYRSDAYTHRFRSNKAHRRATPQHDRRLEPHRTRLPADFCVRAPGTAFVGRTLLFAGPRLECPGNERGSCDRARRFSGSRCG